MTTRPKRTPFLTKKEPAAGGNNPEPLQFSEGDPSLRQNNQSPAVFLRPNFNVGRKRSEQRPVQQRPARQESGEEPRDQEPSPPTVLSKRNLAPGMVEVGKRIVPVPDQQPPAATGVDRIMIRPNMGLKNKKKDVDLLLPPVPPAEVSLTPKSPSFQEGYPERKGTARNPIGASQLITEAAIERNPSFVPEMGPPPAIFLGDLQQLDININQDGKHVSLGKKQRQAERVQQLRKLLNLELDTYEPMLNIGSTTEYDSYISRIKSGYINNSQDQAFDDKMDSQCQTELLAYQQFSQQCPEDRTRAYINGVLQGQRMGQSLSLYNFISRVATVIEQLLRPSKAFEMPPIFLLSLNPKFVSLSCCPYPTTLYRAGEFSIATIGEKLYVCRGEITCLLGLGKFLLAGTRQGGIILWAGGSDRGSLYDSVYSLLNNSDFELPTFSTESVQKQSYFKSTSHIRRLVEKSPSEFYSLEEFGKIISWSIVAEQNNYNQLVFRLKPQSYISLSSLYCEPNLLCYDMEKDPDGKLFVCTSRGIVRGVTEHGQPQLYITDSRCEKVYLSKRGNIMYALCQDNSVQIFDKSLSSCLLKFEVPTKHSLTDILVPRVQTDNRQLEILNQFYLVDSKGHAYRYNLLENRTEPRQIISKANSDDCNLIGVCVTIQDGSLEFLFVNRQLMTTPISENVTVNLDKGTANLKKIIEDNRRFREVLEESVSL